MLLAAATAALALPAVAGAPQVTALPQPPTALPPDHGGRDDEPLLLHDGPRRQLDAERARDRLQQERAAGRHRRLLPLLHQLRLAVPGLPEAGRHGEAVAVRRQRLQLVE